MRMKRVLATVAAAGLVPAFFVGGAVRADADQQKHPPAARVLIVLFDQMLPQYADQFDMPNFRKLRDSGTDYDRAYLGYMASETVISHNVIPSGLTPNHMGYTDEAYRDDANVFGKGVDAMHITGDLSLAE